MKRNEILLSIQSVLIDTLDNESIVITEGTRAIDIVEWDSLMHVLVVDALEKKFVMSFKANEIQSWNNVGEIIDSIERGAQ